MKVKTIYFLIFIEIVAFILGFVFCFETLSKNSKDLFIGALGLLTFISIFYTLQMNSKQNLDKIVINLLKEEKKKKFSSFVKNLKKSKDELKSLDGASELKLELERIDELIDYLDFNKWVTISVLCYLLSIIFYLISSLEWIVTLQIISFWAGVLFSVLIVTSWFVANLMVNNKR